LLSIRGVGVPPELANIQTPEAWAGLCASDPAKAQQLIDYVQRRAGVAQQLGAELDSVRQQQAQIQHTHFQRYAEEQDRIYEASAGKASHELQVAAADVLRDAGLSDQDIGAAWNGAPISLRSAAAQQILADAARWRMAQQKAKAAIARPSPPPQRPGVRMDRMSASAADLQAISRQLDNAGSAQQQLKLAGRLVAERRRAQG
jgi:hypothetical protein